MLPNKLQEAVNYLDDMMYDVDNMKGYAIREELKKVVEMIKDPNYLYLTWNIEDVLAVIAERFKPPDHVEFTEEDARQVLDNISRSHDATIGVNWDVIEVHIENYLEGRE